MHYAQWSSETSTKVLFAPMPNDHELIQISILSVGTILLSQTSGVPFNTKCKDFAWQFGGRILSPAALHRSPLIDAIET